MKKIKCIESEELKMKKNMSKETNWIIHYVADKFACSLEEFAFSPYICDAHTHGSIENYNHPEFQVVLDLGDSRIAFLLNRLGSMVKEGRRFKSGDLVSGIIDDYDLQLFELADDAGKVLRVIIPDKNHHFPEDLNCEFPYCLQYMDKEELSAN